MKKSFVALVAGAFFSIAGVAVAADKPVMLSANQMDTVTAGGVADAASTASALGVFFAATNTTTNTATGAIVMIPTEAGQLTGVLSAAQASSASSAQ